MPTLADYPDLVAQFDRKRNRPLTPEKISYGSAVRFWWTCREGPDHKWQVSANARTQGRGCPFCDGKRVSLTTSLAARAPALVAEWHPTRNRPATPETTHAGTNHKVWWKCGKGHTWQTGVNGRVKLGLGCPYCGHRRVTPATSLAALGPKLAAEWHPTRNGALSPRQVSLKSNRDVWWKCPEGEDHEWLATIGQRSDTPSGRSGCPFCHNRRLSKTTLLSVRAPEVAAQWHPTRNGALTPGEVNYRSMRRAWWRCAFGHEWSTRIHQRTQVGTGCPYCQGNVLTPERSLAVRSPEIARGWHPTRNGALRPCDVMPASDRPVWWKCPKAFDHQWQAGVAARSAMGPDGCPFCRSRRVSTTNSLANCFPKVARQWHPTKNGELTPRKVTHGTARRVWWQCPLKHEWEAPVTKRTRDGQTCPQCRKLTPLQARPG